MKTEKDLSEEKDEIILRKSTVSPGVFRVLVERYEEAFLRKAKTVMHSTEAAEDVVQETFLKIYKNAKNFQKRPGIEFKSWAYKVLMNTSFTHYAKLQKSKGNTSYEDFLGYGNDIPDGEDYAMRHEMKYTIEGVLEKMPEHLAKAMRAYYFEDKSYQTIANEHDISLSALKLRMFRAKKLFRKLLEA